MACCFAEYEATAFRRLGNTVALHQSSLDRDCGVELRMASDMRPTLERMGVALLDMKFP